MTPSVRVQLGNGTTNSKMATATASAMLIDSARPRCRRRLGLLVRNASVLPTGITTCVAMAQIASRTPMKKNFPAMNVMMMKEIKIR